MSVNGLLLDFVIVQEMDIPFKLDSAGVNNPHQGGKGNSDRASVPAISFI